MKKLWTLEKFEKNVLGGHGIVTPRSFQCADGYKTQKNAGTANVKPKQITVNVSHANRQRMYQRNVKEFFYIFGSFPKIIIDVLFPITHNIDKIAITNPMTTTVQALKRVPLLVTE